MKNIVSSRTICSWSRHWKWMFINHTCSLFSSLANCCMWYQFISSSNCSSKRSSSSLSKYSIPSWKSLQSSFSQTKFFRFDHIQSSVHFSKWNISLWSRNLSWTIHCIILISTIEILFGNYRTSNSRMAKQPWLFDTRMFSVQYWANSSIISCTIWSIRRNENSIGSKWFTSCYFSEEEEEMKLIRNSAIKVHNKVLLQNEIKIENDMTNNCDEYLTTIDMNKPFNVWITIIIHR